MPVTRSSQPDDPRRAVTACSILPSPSSKPSATSAQSPAAMSSARARSSGSPESSSSPVITTLKLSRSRRPASRKAWRARTMTTSPPFMSIAPGPDAFSPGWRVKRWNGLSFSNTVSRWPMRRTLGEPARPIRSATRWPARANGAPSTQRVRKPSASSSARSRRPTSCDAREVHRPAVDVDQALDERERRGLARVDGGGQPALHGRERTLRAERRRHERSRHRERGEPPAMARAYHRYGCRCRVCRRRWPCAIGSKAFSV